MQGDNISCINTDVQPMSTKIIDTIHEVYAAFDSVQQKLPSSSSSSSSHAALFPAASPRPTISFEFFPAKTEDGLFNLLSRVDEMNVKLQPTFVSLTWRSVFKDEKLWLQIGSHLQKEFGLTVLLHLTCHLPKAVLQQIVRKARAAGIRNLLVLRGDPAPNNNTSFKNNKNNKNKSQSQSQEEDPEYLRNACELIRLIRQEHGEFFCLACAGYPEVHTENWNHPNCLPPSQQAKEKDLQILRAKQDHGAEFIITQFFYDVDNFLQWIHECRAFGITIPIIPGYLPIQNYNSFKKFTSWCKTRVPDNILTTLESIQNDDAAVREFGIQLAVEQCHQLLSSGLVKSLHFYTMNLASTVTQVLEELQLIPSRLLQRDLPWQKGNNSRRVGATATNLNGNINIHGNQNQSQSQSQAPTASAAALYVSMTQQIPSEQVRPIFWSNRQASYLARTCEWDAFPNGRWGNRASPAYGELSEYYLAFKREKVNRQEIWGFPQQEHDVWQVFVRFIQGEIKQLPWCEQTLALESSLIKENLEFINSKGFLTINSQPRVNGIPSTDPSVGWGSDNGFVFQKAYVEFFCSPQLMEKLLFLFVDFPTLSFHALNLAGQEYRNTPVGSVTAVTWGVFPGQEIVQPTVVDSESFAAWKDEAFELWQSQWACAYEAKSTSSQVIDGIYKSYFLVNIVDNDYTNDKSDIFGIFMQLITRDMTRQDLQARVLQLESKNEKLHETLAKFKVIQQESDQESQHLHQQLNRVRQENHTLRVQMRQLQTQLAMANL